MASDAVMRVPIVGEVLAEAYGTERGVAYLRAIYGGDAANHAPLIAASVQAELARAGFPLTLRGRCRPPAPTIDTTDTGGVCVWRGAAARRVVERYLDGAAAEAAWVIECLAAAWRRACAGERWHVCGDAREERGVALWVAAAEDDAAHVRTLLARAREDGVLEEAMAWEDATHTTPAMAAARMGAGAALRVLHEAGASLSAAPPPPAYSAPVPVWRMAAVSGRRSVLELLHEVARSGDAHALSMDDFKLWVWASGHPEAIAYAVDVLGLEVNPCDERRRGMFVGWAPLHHAARADNVDGVRDLARRGAELNARMHSMGQYTPVLQCVMSRASAALRALLEEGASPHKRTRTGRKPPIALACENGAVECVRVLVQHGADIDAHDAERASGLVLAAMREQREGVRVAIECGADVNKRKNNGVSALHYAAVHGDVELIHMLVAAGANLHACDVYGASPLKRAVLANKMDAARTLLELGASLSQGGRRPAQWLGEAAAQRGGRVTAEHWVRHVAVHGRADVDVAAWLEMFAHAAMRGTRCYAGARGSALIETLRTGDAHEDESFDMWWYQSYADPASSSDDESEHSLYTDDPDHCIFPDDQP